MVGGKSLIKGVGAILLLSHLRGWERINISRLKAAALESPNATFTTSGEGEGGVRANHQVRESSSQEWQGRSSSVQHLGFDLDRKGGDEEGANTTLTRVSSEPRRNQEPTPPMSPENSRAKSLPPRLELLHIQKNAGSLLESLALKANISWGTCHFEFPWRRATPFKDCPPLLDKDVMSSHVYWHYPLQFLGSNSSKIFPYDNHPNASYVARPKKYFVVVRNPYDRLISLFYFSNENRPKLIGGPRAKQSLNKWSQRVLNNAKALGLGWDNATLCQHQYLYDNTQGRSMVDHVVQFEYLAQDFNPLARQYGLDLVVPEHKENARKFKREKVLTVADLDSTTLHLMNTLCEKDFGLARGYQMIWPTNETTTSMEQA